MDRNEVEEKDLRLVEKIRTIVEQKEKTSTRKKIFWRTPVFWLPAVCVALIAIGLIVYNQSSPEAVQDAVDPPPAVVAENTAKPVEVSAQEKVAPTGLAETKAETAAVEADREKESVSDEYAVEPETSSMASSVESSFPIESAADLSDAPAEAAAAAGSATTPVATSDISISHLVTCSGVRDKQFVQAKSTFSLATDPVAMVWMRVLSKTPPFTLKHVYYVNGEHYCDVPLTISYPHMRTWSKITINGDRHIGKWHVDVMGEHGEKLDQVEFTVVQ